ncbi:AraC family transcriptional regulator [Serratia ureilytica]|uniref:AraC family transcriptional regulator n=1 Tax=Serratia TaxID=613 RepID=UPI0018D340EC|nr:AraC family transcriptional regulator [Serratia ureilytica]
MQGVPQQFPFEKDCAQFRHLSHLPGVELYQAHIERYAFEPHTHDAFAIGTVDTGAERFRYRGAQHLAAPGALVLMNPDELHTGEAETPGGWCYRMLYLAPETLERLSGDRSQWFTDAVRHDPRAAQRLSAILAALWQTDDPLTLDGLLLEAVALLQPHIRTGRREKAEAAHRFEVVKSYLHDNFAEAITLNQLAELVSLSPYHFLRKFKAEYHVSPQQMLMAIRLSQAKRMLERGMPAAQVAAAAGLTDQAHLTRAFANRYGVTPVRFQKQVKLG